MAREQDGGSNRRVEFLEPGAEGWNDLFFAGAHVVGLATGGFRPFVSRTVVPPWVRGCIQERFQ